MPRTYTHAHLQAAAEPRPPGIYWEYPGGAMCRSGALWLRGPACRWYGKTKGLGLPATSVAPPLWATTAGALRGGPGLGHPTPPVLRRCGGLPPPLGCPGTKGAHNMCAMICRLNTTCHK